MTEDRTSTATPETKDEIVTDIEATRERLGTTVDELAERVNVPKHAKDRIAGLKRGARQRAVAVGSWTRCAAASRQVQIGAGAAGALVGAVAFTVYRRRA